MADTRTPEERQRDLVGVEQAARLVGVEEIERWRRQESKLRQLERAATEMVAAADATWGLDGWRKLKMEKGPAGRWVAAVLELERLTKGDPDGSNED